MSVDTNSFHIDFLCSGNPKKIRAIFHVCIVHKLMYIEKNCSPLKIGPFDPRRGPLSRGLWSLRLSAGPPTIASSINDRLFVSVCQQLLNIADVQIWAVSINRQPSTETDDGVADRTTIKSILCMPILNGKKDVIGVAQLINKVRINKCVYITYTRYVYIVFSSEKRSSTVWRNV